MWGRPIDTGLGVWARLDWTPSRKEAANTEGVSWTGVDAAFGYTCATSREGPVYCWGRKPWAARVGDTGWFPAEVESSEHLSEVVTGVGRPCGITAEGRAYCWGSTELSLGTAEEPESLYAAPTPVAGKGEFIELAVGQNHVCGVSTSGDVYCWGSNHDGPLGIPERESRVPAQVTLSMRATDVAAGDDFSCILGDDGSIRSWGEGPRKDESGAKPRKLAEGPFEAIDASRTGLCAVGPEEGRCWPDGEFGGRFSVTSEEESAAEQGSMQVEHGGGTVCARVGDGAYRCRGRTVTDNSATGRRMVGTSSTRSITT